MSAVRPFHPTQRTNAEASLNVCDGPLADVRLALLISRVSHVRLALGTHAESAQTLGSINFLPSRYSSTPS